MRNAEGLDLRLLLSLATRALGTGATAEKLEQMRVRIKQATSAS